MDADGARAGDGGMLDLQREREREGGRGRGGEREGEEERESRRVTKMQLRSRHWSFR